MSSSSPFISSEEGCKGFFFLPPLAEEPHIFSFSSASASSILPRSSSILARFCSSLVFCPSLKSAWAALASIRCDSSSAFSSLCCLALRFSNSLRCLAGTSDSCSGRSGAAVAATLSSAGSSAMSMPHDIPSCFLSSALSVAVPLLSTSKAPFAFLFNAASLAASIRALTAPRSNSSGPFRQYIRVLAPSLIVSPGYTTTPRDPSLCRRISASPSTSLPMLAAGIRLPLTSVPFPLPRSRSHGVPEESKATRAWTRLQLSWRVGTVTTSAALPKVVEASASMCLATSTPDLISSIDQECACWEEGGRHHEGAV
mmetsp:Transcript_16464/g.39163  ORF Transcript_16464/g.39163 Transcript_16464/m.39163 type:complete len:313 (+) Transcript_16464:1664-2602(+)